MDRQHFLRTAGLSLASLFISDHLFSGISAGRTRSLIGRPDRLTARIGNEPVALQSRSENRWEYRDLIVKLRREKNASVVEIQSPQSSVNEVTLEWTLGRRSFPSVMNDHWERTYGDVSWHAPSAEEVLPWYFMAVEGGIAYGFGVKTGARAFCFWQVEGTRLRLTLDLQNGGTGVELGDRTLRAAEIVAMQGEKGETPFAASRRMMHMMCGKARMPGAPVYGINDWYFTYGRNSEALIMEHTQLMAPLADGLSNRPFSVIDAGWYEASPFVKNDTCWGESMDVPNGNFGAMDRLAEKIRQVGMRPAIWTRPLCGHSKDPASLMLPLVKDRRAAKPVLDPTIPENAERIKRYFTLYRQWGYDMVKFDFTTFDLLGKWGFEMTREKKLTESGWSFHDRSKTNAEIVLDLYRMIREASGGMLLIGCNTVSHLSAGLFELNRIGDDNSGNEWARTRKMGVNTLAFRGVQHGIFYAADADCVGLTTKIPWEKNRQWMELVARSGTPLFISAQKEAVGTVQKEAIRESFRRASREQPLAEPLDWLESAVPSTWRLNGETVRFNWD